MQPIDPTPSNPLPTALHLIGAAYSLRLPRRPLQHRVELLFAEHRAGACYGRATTRDHSMLVQFNSCMKPDGQPERHTVLFPVSGKHGVVVHGNSDGSLERMEYAKRRAVVAQIDIAISDADELPSGAPLGQRDSAGSRLMFQYEKVIDG